MALKAITTRSYFFYPEMLFAGLKPWRVIADKSNDRGNDVAVAQNTPVPEIVRQHEPCAGQVIPNRHAIPLATGEHDIGC
jgi:hypothetical protein